MKKSEFSEKVKEIKLRQQNWLKQRDEDKKNRTTCVFAPIQAERVESASDLRKDDTNEESSLPSSHRSNSDPKPIREVKKTGAEKVSSNEGSSLPNSHRSNSVHKPVREIKKAGAVKVSSNEGSSFPNCHRSNAVHKQVRDINKTTFEKVSSNEKFKSWRQSRNSQSHRDKSIETSSEIRRDAVAKRVSSDSEIADILSNVDTVDQPPPREHARLISPEQFNELADKIVSKVKNDLQISETEFSHDVKNNSQISKTGFSDEGKNDFCMSEMGLSCQPQYTENPLDSDDLHDKSLSSHRCGICTKLMINKENLPMLLIPCGHSLCKDCSEGRDVCPVCSCTVSSLVSNLTLQQIIQQYQSHRRRTGRPPRNTPYSPNKYTEIKDTSYLDKLELLMTRLEVLNEEKDCELSVYNELSTDLHKEVEQLENINRQETSVSRQLESLKEKLTTLEQHKLETESRCTQMKQDQEEAWKRVAMLEDTLQSLSDEIDKVRLLNEGSSMLQQEQQLPDTVFI